MMVKEKKPLKEWKSKRRNLRERMKKRKNFGI